MAEQWIGYDISLDCGEILGVYQGQVVAVDEQNQTVSLTNAFRNGVKCKVPRVTIGCEDILDLKVLKNGKFVQESRSKNGYPTQNVTKTQCTNKVPALSRNSLPPAAGSACLPAAATCNSASWTSKPRESPVNFTDRKRTMSASTYLPKKQLTPRKCDTSRQRLNDKDEQCFSGTVDSYILQNEFDFESNLALFDKAAVFEEIAASLPQDVVRLADTNKKPQKYRHDEHILGQSQPIYRQIKVPCSLKQEYYTDSGLIIPCVTYELRSKLIALAEKEGLSVERQMEMVGRSASEMVLQLLGGCHRINPENSHQRATVVVLCGPHIQGAQGVCCGRHLSNHNVDVTVFVPNFVKVLQCLQSEIDLYKSTHGRQTQNVKDICNGQVDMIINCMDSHDNCHLRDQSWYKNVVGWANGHLAPVLSIDPPTDDPVLDTKWCLSIALPLSLPKLAGKMYLCDVGVPTKVFRKLGISYQSPFGSKFVIPLHVNGEK